MLPSHRLGAGFQWLPSKDSLSSPEAAAMKCSLEFRGSPLPNKGAHHIFMSCLGQDSLSMLVCLHVCCVFCLIMAHFLFEHQMRPFRCVDVAWPFLKLLLSNCVCTARILCVKFPKLNAIGLLVGGRPLLRGWTAAGCHRHSYANSYNAEPSELIFSLEQHFHHDCQAHCSGVR